jgi:translocator protein
MKLRLIRQVAGLLGWLALSYAVAWFGSRFEPGAWYAGLDKPPWTPPGWAFGVAWSILYTMMAVAAWLIWRRGGFGVNRLPLSLYGLQMLFNALWSWLFFGLRQPGWALADLALLLLALSATLLLFCRQSVLAGALLIPYLAWGLYAFSLNLWIWWFN